MKKLLLSLIAVGALVTGCGGASTPDTATSETPDTAAATNTMEMEGMDSMEGMAATSEGNVEITLVSPDAVPMGDAELFVAVKDAATGEPVTTENLEVEIFMPMDGMDDMTTEAEISPDAEPGQYKVATYLGMAGMWAVNTSVDEGEQQGKAHFMFEAQ
ncbi:FixH family protein [Leptothoe spongobia]|uniref:FixH family protein n=1 Tax=Leptothoe spongobia TAU-MAC 1115 TaxID=1967444 RepID=A0A947DIA4_9CYAN|nr:FixH family protein [Leptothoe spongobia]MBT9317134.1 FixH family protein [Leptothoe spongobia TAU-MAC 1115]